MHRLRELLDNYRNRGSFPTYAQLAEIAYGGNYHAPAADRSVLPHPELQGDSNGNAQEPVTA